MTEEEWLQLLLDLKFGMQNRASAHIEPYTNRSKDAAEQIYGMTYRKIDNSINRYISRSVSNSQQIRKLYAEQIAESFKY